MFAPDMQPVPDTKVVTSHDKHWFKDDTAVNIIFNNRECRDKLWVITDPLDHKHGPECDVQRQLSRLD